MGISNELIDRYITIKIYNYIKTNCEKSAVGDQMDVCQSYFIASRTFYHYNLNHIQWELTQNKVHILC